MSNITDEVPEGNDQTVNSRVLANVRLKLQALEVNLTGLEPRQAEDLIRFTERIADDADFTRCAETAIQGGGISGMSVNGRGVTYSTYLPSIREGPPMRCPENSATPPPTPTDHWTRTGKWRSCSYCGSMHPDDLVEALHAGEAKVDWSSKPYKAYVRLPNVPNASFGPIKFYVWHLTERTVHELFDLGVLRSNDLRRYVKAPPAAATDDPPEKQP